MSPLTGSQRQDLKSEAHHLKPVIQIGQKGLTESLISAVDKALDDHELIKIKFIDFKEEKKEISDDILKATGADFVGMIGNVLTIYRDKEEDA